MPSDPPDSSPGGADDGGPGDASMVGGVAVEFVYLGSDGNPVPGDARIVFPTFTIKEMTMQLHHVELFGDNPPGGHLLERSAALEFPWTNQPRIAFPAAPPGRYTRLDYLIELTYFDEVPPPGFKNQRLSLRVIGSAMIGDEEIDYQYVDKDTVGLQLALDETVVDGQSGTIVVALDLAHWFGVVDWALVAERQGGNSGPGGGGGDGDGDEEDAGAGGEAEGDELVIGLEGDAETAALMRQSLRESFQVRTDL
ncbi:MAG TPA: hypothetical protein VEL05_08930 [Candidatus Acidoferrum sp.]|nr:hypothetical protein [Candidatus Acidoferrum sp.]